MRLTDADEYADFMKTYANGIRNVKPNLAEVFDVIVDSICEWPTVYDIDKVVEQLNNIKKYNLNLADIMLDIQANGINRHFVCLEDVIEIVKAGGKDEN